MASDAHGGAHIPSFPGPQPPSGNQHGGNHVPRSFSNSTGSDTIAVSQSYRSHQSTGQQSHYPPVGYQQTQQYQQVHPSGHHQYAQQQPIQSAKPGYTTYSSPVANDRRHGFVVTETAQDGSDSVGQEKIGSASEVLETFSNRATYMKGYRHFFHACQTTLKWKFPNLYQPAGFEYADDTVKRHRDCFARVHEGHLDDRYISSYDGKIKKLVVQTTDRIYENSPCNNTYRRTFIRNISPWHLRIANWPTCHVDYRKGPPTDEDLPLIILKWLPATVGLLLTLGMVENGGKVRHAGHYDPFPYRYFGVPKVVRNLLEEPTEQKRTLMKKGKVIQPILQERILRPRWLCFLREHTEKVRKGVLPMRVEEWLASHGASTPLEYVVITYASTQFDHNNAADMDALDEIAEIATRAAGVPAYWIASSCMVEENQRVDDVFRISDVIRGAHSTVIAVGPSKHDPSLVTTELMLREWGSRVWTFPEVLLSREGQPIKVYTRNGDLANPKVLSKYQFAAEVWNDANFSGDASVSRELIDHYEGNLVLNRLELVTLAMKCLYRRRKGDKFKGDHAYALMGLLRTRPVIDETDSAFQAFARLSLANDSDRLLERLICVLPADPNQEWHDLDDAYGAQLWEIDPQIQISGIGSQNENPNTPDNTVIIDGCHAANVRWKCFTPVACTTLWSWKRLFATYALRTSGYFFLIACILLSFGFVAVGALLLVWSLPQLLAAPYLIRLLYGGKFWGTQPWFFGFEGYLDIEAVERQIFGARSGRLEWSCFGSPLSRHKVNVWGEYEPLDPTTDPEVKKLVERAERAGPGERRVFTLVDTAAMTVTLFEATRPPIAFLLVGSEGGMKRAMGVSYDWSTSTLYRETVLRFETPVQDAMYRIPRAKVGLRRHHMTRPKGGATV